MKDNRKPYDKKTAVTFKKLLSPCKEIGKLSNATEIGFIAAINLENDEIRKLVRQHITNGKWENAAKYFESTPTDDWVNWFILKRRDTPAAIVEVVQYFELYCADEVIFIKNLEETEEENIEKHIHYMVSTRK